MFFSSINICRYPRKLFEHKANRPSVQIIPEGTGKCNCNEQIWVIVIPPYLPYSNPIRTEIITLDFSKQNGVGCKLSNVITSSQRHNRTHRYRQQSQSGPHAFRILRHANNAGLILSIFKFKPMFKQHRNLLI